MAGAQNYLAGDVPLNLNKQTNNIYHEVMGAK